jgi:hypothetical protein
MSDNWARDACTLPTADRPVRVAEFDGLFAVARRSDRPEPTRLVLFLPRDVDASARDLARRESECCSFFTFGFQSDGEDLVMRVEVPSSQVEVLDAIEARINR